MQEQAEQFARRVKEVIDDREHGSRWLVREAICILRDLAQADMPDRQEQKRLLVSFGRELAQSRPAMAALAGAVSRIFAAGSVEPANVAGAASRTLAEFDAAPARISANARPFLTGRILTCSLSGTVLDTLVANKDAISEVLVLEGRPRYEGRTLARSLAEQGMAVTLMTDAQAGIFLTECRAIVVGADSILASGDILNKAGTALLAWAARGHRIPFYVICETLKITKTIWPADPTSKEALSLLEEKEPEEVLPEAIAGVKVRNFYFDRTPVNLVDRYITEQGLLTPADIRRIALQIRPLPEPPK